MSWTPFYNSWWGAKWRCRNINNKDYKNYWWRWITFTEKWDNFNNFYRDMFSSYKEWLTLDRIDNNWNYCKENCKWSSIKEQWRNTRVNRILEYNWEKKCLASWAEIKKLPQDTLKRRIDKLWWTIKEALSTPKWYPKWVPRVSNVVSFIFPFTGEGKLRYLKWVHKVIWQNMSYTNEFNNNKVIELIKEFPSIKWNVWEIIECEEIYLKEAQDVWTFVHEQMENYLLWKKVKLKKYKEVIEWWFKYIDQVKEKYTKKDGREYNVEQVVVDKYKRYVWAADLVLVNNKTNKVVIIDWKTFWIAKARWKLPNNYKKPYDKIKKGALQFSLYADTYRQEGYTIEGIKMVYLHHTWAYEYDLNLYSAEDLNKILEKYITRDSLLPPDITLLFKYNPMQIEVQTTIPNEAYSKASIIMEDKDLQNGKSIKQNINEVIELQKYLLSKY